MPASLFVPTRIVNNSPFRYLAILLLSLCLHLALLLVPTGDMRRGLSSSALQVRLNVPTANKQTAEVVEDAGPSETPVAPTAKTEDTTKADAPTEGPTGVEKPVQAPLDEPIYYSSLILDDKPRVLVDPLSETAHSLPSSAVGSVVFRLRINEAGEMDEALVEKSDVDAAFLPQLQRAAEAMRFTPGRLKGKEVRTEMHIKVEIENLLQHP